jgi:N-methylhydantoinase A
MLFSDLRYDYVRSCFQRLQAIAFDALETLYRDVEAQGREAIAKSAVRPEKIVVTRYADMRYSGQEHAVTVELAQEIFERQDREGIKKAFDAVHLQRYGTSAPDEPAELVSIRATVVGAMRKPPRQSLGDGGASPAASALKRRKDVYFRETGFVPAAVYDREQLLAGNRIEGPALVEEHASTTVLWPGDKLVVDSFGNLDITIGDRK